MNREEIKTTIENIFKDVLDDETITLTMETTADDIEEWDSLNHIQIVDEIQKHYNLKFTAKEMLSWDCVGDLCDSVLNNL